MPPAIFSPASAPFPRPSTSRLCVETLGHRANFSVPGPFRRPAQGSHRRGISRRPNIYTLEHLPKIRTIIDFDNYYTARLFGFGTAANYFRTQSSNQFLERIRVPTLLVQAKDDPLIPFRVYDHPAFSRNPSLTLVSRIMAAMWDSLPAASRASGWMGWCWIGWNEILNKLPPIRVS